jgi:membrane protein implicated in regulation of membrane protease activity
MLKHALFLALFATGAYAVWIALRVGPALRAYRSFILHAYGQQIAVYVFLFLITTMLAIMLLSRFIFLKDTGSKLQHATKELQGGGMAHSKDNIYDLLKARK